jgi:hypothetical protein
MAEKAAPRVEKVAAAPLQASEPERSAAKRAPIERVEPNPKPLRTCPRVKVRMVFRCNAAICKLSTPLAYAYLGKLGVL